MVLTSVPPIDLLADERQETFQLRKELTCTDLQEIARAKEAIRKDGRRRLVEKWQMRWHGEQTRRWSYRLILELATWLNRKHGEVGFYLAQALSGHGCFNAYLRRFKKRVLLLRFPGGYRRARTLRLRKMGCGKGGPRSGGGCRSYSRHDDPSSSHL